MYHCAQLSYIAQHRAVLIIFPLILQTSIRTETLSSGGRWWYINITYTLDLLEGRDLADVDSVGRTSNSALTSRNLASSHTSVSAAWKERKKRR